MIKRTFIDWIKSQSGATAIEYALLLGGIIFAVLLVMFSTGDSLETMMGVLGTTMSDSVTEVQDNQW